MGVLCWMERSGLGHFSIAFLTNGPHGMVGRKTDNNGLASVTTCSSPNLDPLFFPALILRGREAIIMRNCPQIMHPIHPALLLFRARWETTSSLMISTLHLHLAAMCLAALADENRFSVMAIRATQGRQRGDVINGECCRKRWQDIDETTWPLISTPWRWQKRVLRGWIALQKDVLAHMMLALIVVRQNSVVLRQWRCGGEGAVSSSVEFLAAGLMRMCCAAGPFTRGVSRKAALLHVIRPFL